MVVWLVGDDFVVVDFDDVLCMVCYCFVVCDDYDCMVECV